MAFNDAAFRAQFPAFADAVAFPSVSLSGNWTMGTAYLNNQASAVWTAAQAQLGNDLMAAHLTQLFCAIGAGGIAGVVTGATEGSVSITIAPPPTKNGFQYWLAQTPYGQQIWALLMVVANVGLFFGGSLERSAFRKAGGRF
jgi:hypothetical protein